MNSRRKEDSQPDEEENSIDIIPKQQFLLTLYESIRSDYVSLFKHLYDIDPEAVGALDDKIVAGYCSILKQELHSRRLRSISISTATISS